MSGQLRRLDRSDRQSNVHRGHHRRQPDAVPVHRHVDRLVGRRELSHDSSFDGPGLHHRLAVPDGLDDPHQYQRLYFQPDNAVLDDLDHLEPGGFVHRRSGGP